MPSVAPPKRLPPITAMVPEAGTISSPPKFLVFSARSVLPPAGVLSGVSSGGEVFSSVGGTTASGGKMYCECGYTAGTEKIRCPWFFF